GWCRVEMIRVLVTGGTFDKQYDELRGMLSFGQTHLPEMLRLGRSRVEVAIETLMMIDSLEMSADDRATIVRRCREAAEARIVIPPGPGSMGEPARAGGEPGPPPAGKTIVLTGAMVPYAFGSSDGLFNLGSALSFVQALPAGVYVAMNGRCFNWDRVRKNRDSGTFESVGETVKDTKVDRGHKG